MAWSLEFWTCGESNKLVDSAPSLIGLLVRVEEILCVVCVVPEAESYKYSDNTNTSKLQFPLPPILSSTFWHILRPNLDRVYLLPTFIVSLFSKIFNLLPSLVSIILLISYVRFGVQATVPPYLPKLEQRRFGKFQR